MRLAQPRIAPLADAELTDEQKEVLKPFRPRVFNIFRTLARAPKALDRFNQWGSYVLSRRNDLPPREREIVILRTGFLCKSGYEWTQHAVIGKREGLTDDEIARIKRGRRRRMECGRRRADQGRRRVARRPVHHRRDLEGAGRAFHPEAMHGRGVHRGAVHPGIDAPEQLRRAARCWADARSRSEGLLTSWISSFPKNTAC